MTIIKGYPPNYSEITRKFNIKLRPNIVFTYGDILYNPAGLSISPDLRVHEQVHVEQQLELGVEKWWERYIEDTQFRLEQEVEAYRAQLDFIAHYPRTLRRSIHKKILADITSSIYGRMISGDEAQIKLGMII